MEKQIFILESEVTPDLDLEWDDFNRINYLCWLGLVNKQLDNKANAKEIINVETANAIYKNGKFVDYNILSTITVFDEADGYSMIKGYLVTYKQSEMIADENLVKEAWFAGIDEGESYVESYPTYFDVRDLKYFYQWFHKILK